MAATGFMFARLEESRTEDSIAITGLESSFMHAFDILANTSKYRVVELNPTVKWFWISGRARALSSGSAISEEAVR